MKKNWIWAVGAFALIAAIAVSVVMLGGSVNTSVVANGQVAWASVGRSDRPYTACYMHFKGSDSLRTTIEQPAPAVALVPDSGYAYFFPPVQEASGTFSGLSLVFVNDNGKLVSVMNYEQLTTIFEATKDSAYLEAANYMAALYVDCLGAAVPAAKDVQMGTWYTFTPEQLLSVTSR